MDDNRDKQETTVQETPPMETINQYIDMPIVEFTQKVNEKTFQEVNSMIQLMDIETARLLQVREVYAKGIGTKVKSKMEENFFSYVTTFVLEQKILDRRDILVHVKDLKGAQVFHQEAKKIRARENTGEKKDLN